MTAFWIIFRTGHGWTLAALLSLANLALIAFRPHFWIGLWTETGAAGQVSSFYLSLMACALAAFAASASSRNGMGEQLAAGRVSPGRVDVVSLSALVLTFFIPYCVGILGTAAFTAATWPPGILLWLGYVLMGWLAIFLGLLWGWIIDQYLNALFAAVAAIVTWYAFETIVTAGRFLTVVSGPSWQMASPLALGVRYLASALCLLLIYAAGRARQKPTITWVGRVLPVVGLGCVVTAVLSTVGIVNRPVPPSPTCVDGAIEVCLWPEDVVYVPMIMAMLERVAALPSSLVVPERVDQYGLRRTYFTFNGENVEQLEGLDISEGNKSALALGLSDFIIAETLKGCSFVEPAVEPAPEAVRRWVELYLTDSRTPDYRVSGVPDYITEAWDDADQVYVSRNASQQNEWVNSEIDAFREAHCN